MPGVWWSGVGWVKIKVGSLKYTCNSVHGGRERGFALVIFFANSADPYEMPPNMVFHLDKVPVNRYQESVSNF